MYGHTLSTPLATVGALAVTGPTSMTTWVLGAGIALAVGAGLLVRTRMLRRAEPVPGPLRRSAVPEDEQDPGRTP
ncbi:hypothetical protein [Microbacterium sp. BLY]|uniref:hypothetical protein n=1 Tax=Microbacterium sp. BLY TaxID=2823280 RepID=UPI001B340A57|nr:hypothetical protein [Microbacterium sp. BLY]MBP3977050.1 hypothetical protein [Microbacterium sp. BLY]